MMGLVVFFALFFVFVGVNAHPRRGRRMPANDPTIARDPGHPSTRGINEGIMVVVPVLRYDWEQLVPKPGPGVPARQRRRLNGQYHQHLLIEQAKHDVHHLLYSAVIDQYRYTQTEITVVLVGHSNQTVEVAGADKIDCSVKRAQNFNGKQYTKFVREAHNVRKNEPPLYHAARARVHAEPGYIHCMIPYSRTNYGLPEHDYDRFYLSDSNLGALVLGGLKYAAGLRHTGFVSVWNASFAYASSHLHDVEEIFHATAADMVVVDPGRSDEKPDVSSVSLSSRVVNAMVQASHRNRVHVMGILEDIDRLIHSVVEAGGTYTFTLPEIPNWESLHAKNPNIYAAQINE